MKKLYFIGITFEKNLNQKVEMLKREARDKFNSRWALRSDAHITLIPPFHYEENKITNIREIVKSINTESFDISLSGLGSFGKGVLFIKVSNHKHLDNYKKVLDKEKFEIARDYFKDKCDLGVSHKHKLVIFENNKRGWKVIS